jgi:hypothetical protein
MKFITAFLVVTPFLIGNAFAEAGDGDGDRRSRIQRSIYDVAAGNYPAGYASGEVLVEGRAATMSEPAYADERLGPGSPSDPEYFRHESVSPNNN